MKNISKFNIHPHSENCFEHSVVSEGYKLYKSDFAYEEL